MSENPNYQQNPGEFIPAPQQAPAYNMQGGYPGYQPTPSSALAIASLILGIIGLLSGWLIFGGALGLVGVILPDWWILGAESEILNFTDDPNDSLFI